MIQITLNKNHILNYEKGDIVKWLKTIENIGIDSYEIVPVTSSDNRYHIDLSDKEIYEKFELMVSEYADYILQIFRDGITTIPFSNIFTGTILRIIKRESTDSCNAGFSFCVTPELKAYPCHMFIDDNTDGIKFDCNFRNNIKNSPLFIDAINCNKSTIYECNECEAKHVCSYLCKGMCLDNNYSPNYERCLFMKIILKKIIIFLTNDYNKYKENIKKVLIAKNVNL